MRAAGRDLAHTAGEFRSERLQLSVLAGLGPAPRAQRGAHLLADVQQPDAPSLDKQHAAFAREGGKVALDKKKKGAIKIGSISAKVGHIREQLPY